MIKIKENQPKRAGTQVYLGISKLIVDLTSLFDDTIVLDRRDFRRLTANYAWFNLRLKFSILDG